MGRSTLISIPSTPSLCRTACIMKKTFLLILLGLVTLALSEIQEENQENEIEESLDENELEEFMELTENEEDSLENSRLKRDANPKKSKPKGGKGGKGGNKNGGKKSAKKNKSKGG